MYEAFYGFREKPFSILPDPSFLYFSREHSMALDLLEYGLMNQAGFNVITGEIGTGKTTLVRYVLSKLGEDVTVGLISNTHRSFGELLQWILYAFRLQHRGKEKVEMFQDFVDFLVEQYAQNRRTLLIVDEAQNMSADTLEELRMLSNVNADKDQVLQVILVGQAGLRDTLRRPEMEQFAQRIAVDYHLEPLDRQETHEYIYHRIKVVGADGTQLFDAAACDAVYDHSRGVPRLINLLCDTALVYGFAEQKKQIDARIVVEVARDKQKGGIFPGQRKSNGGDPGVDSRAPAADARPSTLESREPEVFQPAQSPLDQEYYAEDVKLPHRGFDLGAARGRMKPRK
jgi:general secretion pathway protein A